MTVQMTKEQLEQLIQALRAAPTAGAGAAAIVGRLGPCELGRDKLKRYKRFIDWVGEAESKNTGGSNPYAVIIEEVFGLDKIEFLQVTLLL